MRTVYCDHVLSPMAITPVVEPMPRSQILLAEVTILVALALCANCYDMLGLGSPVAVQPRTGDPDTVAIPRMMVHAGSKAEAKARQSGKRPAKPEPEPAAWTDQSTVKVLGHSVTVYREPRLQDRAIAEWAGRFADGEVTPAAFRRIVAAIKAGPLPEAAIRRSLDLPAVSPREAGLMARLVSERPQDAPSKRSTKVRLKWDPRTGFYDASQPRPATQAERDKAQAERQARIDALMGTPRRTPSGTPRRRPGTPKPDLRPAHTCDTDAVPGIPGIPDAPRRPSGTPKAGRYSPDHPEVTFGPCRCERVPGDVVTCARHAPLVTIKPRRRRAKASA